MLSANRPRKCKWCKESFTPERNGQKTHKHCEEPFALKVAGKLGEQRRKAERAQDKARRKALETIPELIRAAQREFNAYIRERDKHQPCICCGEPLGTGDVGGGYDCGHYRSTGSAAHLRFDERNAHAQRKRCNRWGAGRAVDYRIGLIARIGLAAVEALENDNTPKKWGRDELRQIAATYRTKLRELKARSEE